MRKTLAWLIRAAFWLPLDALAYAGGRAKKNTLRWKAQNLTAYHILNLHLSDPLRHRKSCIDQRKRTTS